MYKIYSRGPSVNPCGTPLLVFLFCFEMSAIVCILSARCVMTATENIKNMESNSVTKCNDQHYGKLCSDLQRVQHVVNYKTTGISVSRYIMKNRSVSIRELP